VVASAAPFQRTAELGRKPLPATARVRAPEPAGALAGVRLVAVGVVEPRTVKVS